MKLKLLSWNVREANDSNKRKDIKVLIRAQKVDLVCLQETKIQEMSFGVVCNLGVGRFLERGVLMGEEQPEGWWFFGIIVLRVDWHGGGTIFNLLSFKKL